MARPRRAPRVDPGGLFGCAGIFVFFAGFVTYLGYHNHTHWRQRQGQIPRFQKIHATVREKGIAHYTSRDKNGGTRTEDQKWIHFTCHVGDRLERDGARLNFSGSDAGWESYVQGRDYDAFYDPAGDECVLVLDEVVGDPDYGLLHFLFIAKLFGGTALLLAAGGLFLRLRR